MSWNKICKALCCCRKKPVSTPTQQNSFEPIEAIVVRPIVPSHRYTETIVDIHQALATPKL